MIRSGAYTYGFCWAVSYSPLLMLIFSQDAILLIELIYTSLYVVASALLRF